jgi:hypothetical protein
LTKNNICGRILNKSQDNCGFLGEQNIMFNRSSESIKTPQFRKPLVTVLALSGLAFVGCAQSDKPTNVDHIKTEITQQNTTSFTSGEQVASTTTLPNTTSTIEKTTTSKSAVDTEQIPPTTSSTEADASTPTSANVLPLLCPGMPDIRQNHTAPNCPPPTA